MADLNELRQAGPIYWNEHGGYWVSRGRAWSARCSRTRQCSPTTRSRRATRIPRTSGSRRTSTRRSTCSTARSSTMRSARRRSHGWSRRPARTAGWRSTRSSTKGRCDYVADVGGVFPTRVFLELVDLPWQDAPLFVAWTETLFDGFFTGPEAMVAFDEVTPVLRRPDRRAPARAARPRARLRQSPADRDHRRPADARRGHPQHLQPARCWPGSTP